MTMEEGCFVSGEQLIGLIWPDVLEIYSTEEPKDSLQVSGRDLDIRRYFTEFMMPCCLTRVPRILKEKNGPQLLKSFNFTLTVGWRCRAAYSVIVLSSDPPENCCRNSQSSSHLTKVHSASKSPSSVSKTPHNYVCDSRTEKAFSGLLPNKFAGV
ncbi:hypothetical protein GOODEAATRI_007384 [Goodea atripinnis]|uniref:Uncharacterized protein n=1 Tax=Goodea atripinnis TaxID=208336 RepID=A0ABV0MG66_9TELE